MSLIIDKKVKLCQEALGFDEPGFFDVLVHNDDFTPKEFAIELLKMFFHLDGTKAKTIMLEAHTKGRAVCGTYNREVAEARIDQAIEYARKHDHPLLWSMEAA